MAKKKERSELRVAPTPSPPPISRNCYDLHWLEVEDTTLKGRVYKQHRVSELDGVRPEVEPYLAAALHDHHTYRKRVAALLRELGHAETAAFFANEMPKADRTRKGNFGEVVASEHLVQRYGCSMPVYKLRHRDGDLPMRGEDIVAFELDAKGSIKCVVIGEAKAVKKFRTSTVTDAYARLKAAYKPRPKTLSLLSNILMGQGNEALATQIDLLSVALTKRNVKRKNWVFLINEAQPDDPFGVLAQEAQKEDQLCCVGITLPGLTQLVNALFDSDPTVLAEGS